ncbi:unnamed protein product [Rhizoctonia solani]|uniref:non-specific serine/threonine protein kinase n=1 Tax=Rhizoctonia solani TaxID=456999 RepID=A0A8H3BBJ8_9AGAM|nr:unnamed protein product [Rhizoctonia solani]
MGRTSWRERWTTLRKILVKTPSLSAHSGDEDDIIGAQLDIGGHSQDVAGARFGDKDLVSQGGLPGGQFGEIDVALCRLDNALYVRKAQPRRQALQATRERDVLLCARRTGSVWSPHLLCAFKEGAGCGYPSNEGPLTYTLVMSYVPGGTLEDVLESCTVGGLAESDVQWWFSQAISAIGWLHEQGWAHRDIKPSNLAITSTKHLQLLDFGCAAPISLSTSPKPGLSPHRVLPYDDCLVPCGTCDYLSPEILIWHEDALARARKGYDDEEEEEDTWAQDFTEDVRSKVMDKLRRSVNSHDDSSEIQEGYGPETDWWSLGAMIYELTYGVAPFFAPDVATTYKKVLAHKKNLKFPAGVASNGLQLVLGRLLTDAEQRLGRRSTMDIQDHAYFKDVDWENLHTLPAPPGLVTPQFTYAPPVLDQSTDDVTQEQGGFAFSAFFQSTVDESNMGLQGGDIIGGRTTGVQGTGSRRGTINDSRRLTLRPGTKADEDEEPVEENLGGFSWGPPCDAFDHEENTLEPDEVAEDVGGLMAGTPFRLKVPVTPFDKPTPFRQPLFGLPSATPMRQTSATPFRKPMATPFQHKLPAATPFKQSMVTPYHQATGLHKQVSATPFRPATTPFRQPVSGPDHTYRSSGHLFKTPVRPGVLPYNSGAAGSSAGNEAGNGTVPGTGTARRTRAVTEAEALRQVLESARKRVYLGGEDSKGTQSILEASGRSLYAQDETQGPNSNSNIDPSSAYDDQSESQASKLARPALYPIMIPMLDASMSSSDGAAGPISPSPSPRPGSALSRRSATPSAMLSLGAMTPSAMYSRSASKLSIRANTPTWGRPRRDESEEDILDERERRELDRERRERAEKHRRAILEKERERSRREELARLERQKEKGKGREESPQRPTPEEEPMKQLRRQPSRLGEGSESKDSDDKYSRPASPERPQAADRSDLERQAQAKLEQERRRLEKKQAARKREESLKRDQEVEAARAHELALADEMARQDGAKRAQGSHQRVRSYGGQATPAIRVNPSEAQTKESRSPKPTGTAQLGPPIELMSRRRVKSVDLVLDSSKNTREPQPSQERIHRDGAEIEGEGMQRLVPQVRARTRSHEPLRPSAAATEESRPMPRTTLESVSERQRNLTQDVDALQARINEALRMFRSGQN